MKLIDALADIIENPPDAALDTPQLLHEAEVEDLFHKVVVAVMVLGGTNPETGVLVGIDWVLYALRRHGLPDDLHNLPMIDMKETP